MPFRACKEIVLFGLVLSTQMGFFGGSSVAACFLCRAVCLQDLVPAAEDFIGWLYLVCFPADGQTK